MSRSIALVQREPSRFDVARQEAAARATLQECGNELETGANALERARSLVNAGISAYPGQRAELSRQVMISLRASIEALTEVAREMEA